MRKLFATVAVMAVALAGAGALFAASHMEKATVKGGSPMGLKGEDGKVYLVIADHGNEKAFDEAKGHCGHNVEVTGSRSMKGDMNVLVLSSVKML